MTDQPMSVVDALESRARLILSVLAGRSYSTLSDRGDGTYDTIDAGHWVGFGYSDPLVGVLEDYGTIRWTRPGDGHDSAALRMGNLEMVSFDEIRRSDVETVESNIEESYRDVLKLGKPVHYTEVIEHTFSRTTSEAEATKAAWEVAAKASIGVGWGPIKGSLEVSGKYDKELEQRASQSDTDSDRLTRTIDVQGPVDIDWEAYRSRDRQRRTVTARGDFDHAVWVDPGPDRPGMFSWDSYKHDFLPVVARLAPETAFLSTSFQQQPIDDSTLAALRAPADALVTFTTQDFDNVQTQHITVT